jgi:spore maturation protein CgeB
MKQVLPDPKSLQNSKPDREPLVLVGNPGPEHVGNHLRNAAQALHVPVRLCDSDLAYRAWSPIARFNWWLRSHRPTRLDSFSREVIQQCSETHAGCLLSTGLAPLNAETLEAAGRSSVVRMNFLTDDPWNPSHKASWFMRALPRYDVVFSPRRANMDDLRRAGCDNVIYLPFAYEPEIHFPEPPSSQEEQEQFGSDVVFAGGADAERVPFLKALIQAGVRVGLYGGYWGRYPETRAFDRGLASAATLRKAVGAARIALCLVRRANRDGHAMRTYELAAMGACILAEDTEEHREILGPEGVSAVYFRSLPEMLERVRELLPDDSLRNRLATAVRTRICSQGNTYRDRLAAMLGFAGQASSR